MENNHGGGSFSFIALKVKYFALYLGQFFDNLKVIILVFYIRNCRIKIIYSKVISCLYLWVQFASLIPNTYSEKITMQKDLPNAITVRIILSF